jgi:hypothetical protein
MFVEQPRQTIFPFNTIVSGEILFRQAAMIMKLEIARRQPAPGWRV